MSAIALGAWLALPLVVAKAVHWGRPGAYGWSAWLRDVAVSSHQDVAFCAAFALAAACVLLLVRRWPRVERWAGAVFVAAGALSVLYAVVSVQIFAFLRSPLTYALLYLAGDPASMRSSIGSFVSPGLVAACVLMPAAYATLVRRTPRAAGMRGTATGAAFLAIAAAWTLWGAGAAGGRWSDRSDVLIAKSPHVEILASTAAVVRGEQVPVIADTFPPGDLDDFRPGTSARGAAPHADAVRNVVVVVLESTGARYLSLYGSRYATTPHLQAEAAHAVVYDRAYANVGFTANALVALTLSMHPYMTWREYTQEHPDFPGRTAAGVLQARGYRTAFLTSGFVDYVNQDGFLRDRGFDEVRGFEELALGEPINSWGGGDAALVDRALEWIDRDRTRPFFATVWTQQAHHPYDPAPGQPVVDYFEGAPLPPDDYDLGRYLNAVADVDRAVGRLFAGLRARGLDDETIVVVTADHGEAFGDPHATWGHGFRLYDEGVKIPLLVWSPVLFPQGRRVDTVGSHGRRGADGARPAGRGAAGGVGGEEPIRRGSAAPRVLLRRERPLPPGRPGRGPQVRLRREPRPRPALRPRARPGRAGEPRRRASRGLPPPAPAPRRVEAPRRAAARGRALADRGRASRGPRRDRRHAVARYALLLAAIGALLGARSLGASWIGDFWIYAATVGELAVRPFHPVNPLLGGGYAFAFHSPYLVALGLVARITGAQPVDVLVAQGLVNLALLAAALYAFVATWVRRPPAAFYALLFLLLLWGRDPWSFSGFFHLRSLAYVLPYPSTFAAAVALGTLAAFARLADAPKAWVPLVVAVGALLFAVHPVTALFLWVGLFAWSLGAPRSRVHWMLFAAAAAAGFGLALAWPLVPMRELWFGQLARVHEGNDSMYDGPLARIAPALLGLPVLVLRLRRDRRDPLAIATLLLGLLVVYGGITGAWTYGRLIAPAVILLQVALAGALADAERRLEGRPLLRLALPAVLAALLLAGSWTALGAVVREARNPGDRLWLRFLAQRVGRDDVVMTDRDTCWYVPAFAGRVVAYPMQLPFVPDHAERLEAVGRFFEPGATESERRALLARYRVAYVLVPKHHFPDRPELRAELQALGPTVYSDVEYDLVDVGGRGPTP